MKANAVPVLTPPAPRPGINAAAVAAIVDELGVIGRKLAPWRLAITQEEALRKSLRAQFDASPADLAFDAVGDHYTAQLGPKALQRTVNPIKLLKAVGQRVFMQCVGVTLASLERNGCGVPDGVITEANSGARSIKLFERGTKTA